MLLNTSLASLCAGSLSLVPARQGGGVLLARRGHAVGAQAHAFSAEGLGLHASRKGREIAKERRM